MFKSSPAGIHLRWNGIANWFVGFWFLALFPNGAMRPTRPIKQRRRSWTSFLRFERLKEKRRNRFIPSFSSRLHLSSSAEICRNPAPPSPSCLWSSALGLLNPHLQEFQQPLIVHAPLQPRPASSSSQSNLPFHSLARVCVWLGRPTAPLGGWRYAVEIPTVVHVRPSCCCSAICPWDQAAPNTATLSLAQPWRLFNISQRKGSLQTAPPLPAPPPPGTWVSVPVGKQTLHSRLLPHQPERSCGEKKQLKNTAKNFRFSAGP